MDNNQDESALDRARRILVYVEEMIALVSEHPECELKREWRRDTPYHKAEFVKDFQSIANSTIPVDREKYLVVGADEATKTIVGCSHADYDEAGIRQLLETYLDPVPEFEVLRMTSSGGMDFVIVRIPHQPHRPFVARAAIRDNNRTYMEEGEIWVKPGGENTGSTGKRRVRTRAEVLGLIDIEPRVQQAVAARLEQLVPQIRLEERTRLQGSTFSSISALTATDEEFESYVEQLLSENRETQFNILIEKLRDRAVAVWEFQGDSSVSVTPEDVLRIKETEFLPAMRRLVHLGLLLIKFSGPLPWFNQIAGLLVEVFNASRQLRRRLPEVPSGLEVKSLEEHASYTVPAWESLIAAYLMAGYELGRRNSSTYLATLFPRRVKYILGGYDEEPEAFYLFWPVTHRWGGPNRQRDLLVLDRYGRGDRIEAIAGGKEAMRIGVLQFDCLVDFHSVMSFSGQGEPETADYFDAVYPNVNTTFYPHFTHEHLQLVLPLVDKLWSALQTGGENNYWLFDGGLAKVVAKIDVQRRKTLLARFLVYAEKERGSWMWATQRLPTPTYWRPEELKELIKSLRQNA